MAVLLAHSFDLLEAFHQREAQEDEHGKCEQPFRPRNARSNVTRHEPQSVKSCEEQDIQQSDLFQLPRVTRGDHEVERGDERELERQIKRNAKCDQQE